MGLVIEGCRRIFEHSALLLAGQSAHKAFSRFTLVGALMKEEPVIGTNLSTTILARLYRPKLADHSTISRSSVKRRNPEAGEDVGDYRPAEVV